MTLSVLSHKRNHSACTTKTHACASGEPVSKLSKLNFIISKLTRPLRLGKQTKEPQQLVTAPFSGGFLDRYPAKPYRSAVGLSSSHVFSANDQYERNRYQKLAAERREGKAGPHIPLTSQSCVEVPCIQIQSPTPTAIHRHTLSTQSAPRLDMPTSIPESPAPSTATYHATYTRRPSCLSSSNITVASEDLTAKEFADIAGIKIIPDDTLQDGSGSDEHLSLSVASSSHLPNNSNDPLHNLSVLSGVSQQSSGRPHIWETQFWRRPDDPPQLRSRPSLASCHLAPPSPSTPTRPLGKKTLHRQTMSLPPRTDEMPIVSELRRMRTTIDGPAADQPARQGYMMRKGRFEIHLETETTISPAKEQEPLHD